LEKSIINKTTKQQNNKTTKQQNNKTTKQFFKSIKYIEEPNNIENNK